MKIEQLKLRLKETLEKHKYPPYEENREVVYIGLPERIEFADKQEKYEFIYLLCMFIAFDLKTYEIFNEFYPSLKKEFYIPKFEHGLTNTFVYPNRIFNHYKIGVQNKYFENSFEIFYNFALKLTEKIDPKYDFEKLLKSICNDKDLNTGLFGKAFVNSIKRKINYTPTKTPISIISAESFKDKIKNKKYDFWEIIIPFSVTMGSRGNLPSYLTLENCSILTNGTGIVIIGHIFSELIKTTTILDDFNTFYFFNFFATSEHRYDFDFENFKNIDDLQADEILIVQ